MGTFGELQLGKSLSLFNAMTLLPGSVQYLTSKPKLFCCKRKLSLVSVRTLFLSRLILLKSEHVLFLEDVTGFRALPQSVMQCGIIG